MADGLVALMLTFRKRKNDGRKRCDDMKKAACEGRISSEEPLESKLL